VIARDDQPVVLGGLIRESDIHTTSQVPGLGSVPILGWLFKRKKMSREKKNLLVILVPHVVETPDDIRRIHERRTQERLDFLERYTNFKKRDLDAAVNYRKKNGLLATVDSEARRLEQEEIILRQAEEDLRTERITGELGDSPRLGEEEGGTEESTSSGSVAPQKSSAAPPKAPKKEPLDE